MQVTLWSEVGLAMGVGLLVEVPDDGKAVVAGVYIVYGNGLVGSGPVHAMLVTSKPIFGLH